MPDNVDRRCAEVLNDSLAIRARACRWGVFFLCAGLLLAAWLLITCMAAGDQIRLYTTHMEKQSAYLRERGLDPHAAYRDDPAIQSVLKGSTEDALPLAMDLVGYLAERERVALDSRERPAFSRCVLTLGCYVGTFHAPRDVVAWSSFVPGLLEVIVALVLGVCLIAVAPVQRGWCRLCRLLSCKL